MDFALLSRSDEGKENMNDDMNPYLMGDKLYGDDFTPDEIQRWYEKEKEGYGNLVQHRHFDYSYEYHTLNVYHGFRYVQLEPESCAMAIGGAFCEELRPVVKYLARITNLEPSSYFDAGMLDGVPIEHVKPSVTGQMPFSDESFDLITCFGVLHHIPNVSFVVGECFRTLRQGGAMLLREPIVSMGDWRKPRAGLTANERGIPEKILIDIVTSTGFYIRNHALCDFSPLTRLSAKLGVRIFSSKVGVLADSVLSNLFRFNMRYHRSSPLHKFAPAGLALVLIKPAR